MATERDEDKRSLILDAAQRVFSKKGFHRATVEEVAEVAGVGKGTVYLYFASKNELFVALIEDRMRAIKAFFEEKLREKASSTSKLKELIAMHFQLYSRYRDFLAVMFGEVGHLGQELDRRTRDARLEIITLIEHVIDEGIKRGEFREIVPRLATYALEGMTNFLAFHWLVREGRPLSKEDIEQVVELYLRGIARPSQDPV
ncbi:MAG TPA: TetR/AcrR family transcriptional regulator [Firmicutes bacterium]|nr:TetR/AcrR family transcriptional regulator [Bacillota bacterium]